MSHFEGENSTVVPEATQYTPETKERQQYRDFATALAKEVGQKLMEQYRHTQKRAHSKIGTDLKIQLDQEIDHHIRERIGATFPDHAINSEEDENKEGESSYRWIIDPLDGTIGYTRKIGHFGVAIGLVKDEKPILGIFYAPKDDEFYEAYEGEGARLNGQELSATEEPVTELNGAVVAMDFGKENRTAHTPYHDKLLRKDGVIYPLSLASAATSLCYVADGRLDAYASLKLEPWDMTAAVVILREAGYKVTDSTGKEWELGDESILAANPALHQKILELFHEEN